MPVSVIDCIIALPATHVNRKEKPHRDPNGSRCGWRFDLIRRLRGRP